MGKRTIALSCCVLLVGCGTPNPFADQFKVPNPFGSFFQDKQEVLQHIPVGTPVEDAQVVLRAHGFEQWSRLQQGNQVTLIYHVSDLARLRAPDHDTWVILYLKRGAVVDAEVHT